MKLLIVFVLLKVILGKPALTSENGGQLLEDDPCTIDSQTNGICKPVDECSGAIELIRNRQYEQITRCGFKQDKEIVCCPSETKTTSRTRYRTTTEATSFSFTEPITTRSNIDRLNNTNENRVDTNNRIIGEVADRTISGSGSKAKQACTQHSNEVRMSLAYHILGGENAELGEFPHMTTIGYQYEGEVKFECGGSLISDQFILTAAHCVVRNDDIPIYVVRLGMINLQSTDFQEYQISKTFVHPSYRSTSHYNDIALLKLTRTATYTENVHPACLYLSNDPPPRGLLVTGWGITDFLQGEQSVILQKATLEFVEDKDCKNVYQTRRSFRLKQGLQNSQMCASYGNGTRKDACSGDSGGPLQVQTPGTSNMWTIVGITSFGVGCGSPVPGVYTKVAHYIDWIESIVWPN